MSTPSQARWKSQRYIVSGKPSTPEEVALHAISCLPPEGVKVKGTMLLIHGWPGTSYQFRHVITPLADAGYHVVVPDYRGAGRSSQPRSGYDKFTMASDLHSLLVDGMGMTEKIHVVGYDIGGTIAVAYAMNFPEHTATLVWGDGVLPGSRAFDKALAANAYGGMWHFIFHWQTDIPDLLVDTPDKIRSYIKLFYDRISIVSGAFTDEDVDHYAKSFSQVGAMRSGFDVYRAFHQDAKDNQEWLEKNGKIKIPCMMINGGGQLLGRHVRRSRQSILHKRGIEGGAGKWSLYR